MAPERPEGADAFPKCGLPSPIPAARPRREAPRPGRSLRALDLGTNSCRMLIAQPKGNQLHVVDSFSKSVQLGHGAGAFGRLSRQSMARTVSALKICASKLQRHDVTRMRLVATEACRRASNAGEFISVVERETGLNLRSSSPRRRRGLPWCPARRWSPPDRPASGGRYRRRLDRTGVDRPQPRAAAGTAARDHAAAPGVRHRRHGVSEGQGGGLDLHPAGGGDAEGSLPRRDRRWRALRAHELVFRGTTGRVLALRRCRRPPRGGSRSSAQAAR